MLGVRRWRELVADRKKWKDIVRQAEAHSVLLCQCKKNSPLIIVNWIKGQRISWLGHLERIEDRMPKKIFTQELEGTRRSGIPRKRYKEEAGRDLQVLGVRRWRELAADR